MTSRNLYFNLIKEDVKRRAWVIALNALVMFFALPIAAAMMAGDDSYSEDRKEMLLRTTRLIMDWVSVENGLIVFLVGAFAILCSFSGFAYLNSRKKVDFYHSLPVKRGTLFAVYYVNGILIFTFTYLINLLTALGIAAVNGADMVRILPVAWTGFWVHLLGFLILYATVTAAVQLTGNIVIAFLGSAVFFTYCPMLNLIVSEYFRTWFRTYGYFQPYSGTNWFYEIMENCSPAAAYINMVSAAQRDTGKLFGQMAGTVAAAAVLTVISLLLHRLRPSEACGKAMAFQKTKPVIRILLVIPIALTGSLMFYSIRSSFGWAVFGTICIGVISHCIIEIIYHFDFRKLFAHWRQMGLCVAAALLILFTFKYDLLGYDTYRPGESSVRSAAVEINRLDEWVIYGEVYGNESDDNDSINYRWSYSSMDDFVYQHMELTDLDDVMKLVDAGIARNTMIKKGSMDEYSEEEGSCYATVNVLYRLKNGRCVGRSYYLPLSTQKEAVEALYLNPDYKDGVYPILSQPSGNTASVHYQEQDHITQLEIGKDYDREAELTELLDTYREEFKALSIGTRSQESPVGMIQFMDDGLHEAVNYLKSKKSSSAYNLEQRCYYPVYPSFQKTIALLEKYGVTPGAEVAAGDVDQIMITESRRLEIDDTARTYKAEAEIYYDKDYAEETEETGDREYTFTEPNQIEAVMSALIPRDYADMNRFNQTDYYSNVTVTVGSGPRKKEYFYRLDVDQMPEFLKQVMNFNATRKNVKYDW